MSTYERIKTVPLSLFNNAEYLTYINQVLALLLGDAEEGGEAGTPEEISLRSAGGVPELGISEEFINELETELMALADAVDASRVAQETEEMNTHEDRRDKLVSYVTSRIMLASTLPLEAEQAAGNWLRKIAKLYLGVAQLGAAQETSKIRGLLLDLRKPENAPHVTTLGLDTYLTELEKENEAYDQLAQKRSKARVANKKESGTSIRARVDALYADLTLLAQSYNVVQPTERSTAFVRNLNQCIDDNVTANKLRRAALKGSSAESGGTGSPEEI